MEEGKIRKVLSHELSLMVYLVGIVFSFIMFVVVPNMETQKNIALIQKDISIINTNHESHIQDILVELKEIKVEMKDAADERAENREALIKVMERL